jgi:dTDP-glucose pyrophosphorylase
MIASHQSEYWANEQLFVGQKRSHGLLEPTGLSMKSKQAEGHAIIWDGQSIRDTLSLIDSSIIGGVVFVDRDQRVLGFVSDGDVRRALIKGAELTDPISDAWTNKPLTVPYRTSNAVRYRLLKQRNIRHLIVLDSDGRYRELQTFQDVENQHEINPQRCPVVLMAGGRGTRLMPLTADRPKPMLHLDGEPLLQRTLKLLIKQGFEEFYISVNYLKEQVMEHFGDGSELGVDIRYLVEDQPFGTGGCLQFLPKLDNRHFLLLNGDLITNLNFRGLITFHDAQQHAATMVVREVSSTLEYGVVRVDGSRFLRLDEKPTHRYFINTGIYALSASVLNELPGEGRFDMPDLFDKLVEDGRACGVFEHKGQWIDIGTPDQLEVARQAVATMSQSQEENSTGTS